MNATELHSVIFAGIELNNGEFSSIALHDFNQMPTATENTAQIVSSHSSVVTSKWFTSKTARVSLFTRGCTVELQAKIAKLRAAVQSRQAELVLNSGVPKLNGVYEYDNWDQLTYSRATIGSMDVDLTGSVMTAELEFNILDPIGLGDTQTLFSGTGITDNNTSIDLTIVPIQGTFYVQYPVYTIRINSITQGSTPSLSITNQTNTITYIGGLNSGDVLELDTHSAMLKRNGNNVDYNGSVPSLPLAGSPVNISDTFSARNIDITITNQARYI